MHSDWMHVWAQHLAESLSAGGKQAESRIVAAKLSEYALGPHINDDVYVNCHVTVSRDTIMPIYNTDATCVLCTPAGDIWFAYI